MMMISNGDDDDDDDDDDDVDERNQVVFDFSTHIAFPTLLTKIFLNPGNEGVIKRAMSKSAAASASV